MKVGIISINMYSKGLNFACPIHTYAFQQFLLQNGIDCTVLDYKPVYFDKFDMKYPAHYYKEKYDFSLKEKANTDAEQKELEEKQHYYKGKFDSWTSISEQRAIRYDKVQKFIDTHYIKTDICYDSDLLEVMDPGFECYICATDVIWKNQPDYGFDRGFFLGSSCMENKHKIAYSASRGVYFAQTDEEKEQFFYYLKDFDNISVREKSLKEYIEENSEIKVSLTLDPVLLHDKNFYEKLCLKPPEEHYVLLYYVQEKAKETIRQSALYAKAHNMKIIEITDVPIREGRLKDYPDVDYTLRYDIGIEQWLGYILYADCIFTNSFHACCFSLLFEKQFFAGHRNSEKVSLFMNLFGLDQRILINNGDPVLHAPADIDYNKIRPLLKEQRDKSADYILNAIQQAENKPRQKHDYSDRKKRLSYYVQYNSGTISEKLKSTWDESGGTLEHFPSGSMEFMAVDNKKINDGNSRLDLNRFSLPHYRFAGWRLRIYIDNRWFWVMSDGTLKLRDPEHRPQNLKIFKDNDLLPYFPINNITAVVAEANWKPKALYGAAHKLKQIFKPVFG